MIAEVIMFRGRVRTASSSAGENRVRIAALTPRGRVATRRARGSRQMVSGTPEADLSASNRDAELSSRASGSELRTRAEPCWVLPV
jgi:hypothetical protein